MLWDTLYLGVGLIVGNTVHRPRALLGGAGRET